MKMIGSAYLVLLGIRYLRNSFRDDGAGNPAGRNASIASMRLDFLTRVANPQNALPPPACLWQPGRRNRR